MDFIVVEPQVTNWAGEMVRLHDALLNLPLAVDVVVYSRDRFDYWRDTPNTLPYVALKEGRVYEQVA